MRAAWLPLFLLASSAVVSNEHVVVMEATLAPGESQAWPDGHPAVVVYFTAGSLDVEVGPGATVFRRVSPGESLFDPGQVSVKNTGTAPVHFARIEFLGNGSAATWGTTGLSPHYKVLLENQYARVYDIRIPARSREPQHTHHDRVVVCLSGAQLKHLFPDGREEPSTLETGEIAWRRGSTHIGQNVGQTNLWVIAVEPK